MLRDIKLFTHRWCQEFTTIVSKVYCRSTKWKDRMQSCSLCFCQGLLSEGHERGRGRERKHGERDVSSHLWKSLQCPSPTSMGIFSLKFKNKGSCLLLFECNYHWFISTVSLVICIYSGESYCLPMPLPVSNKALPLFFLLTFLAL